MEENLSSELLKKREQNQVHPQSIENMEKKRSRMWTKIEPRPSSGPLVECGRRPWETLFLKIGYCEGNLVLV